MSEVKMKDKISMEDLWESIEHSAVGRASKLFWVKMERGETPGKWGCDLTFNLH